MAIDTIGTNAIANNSVTAAKIPAGAVDADITTLPDNSVTTAKIASTAVTDAKLANDAVTSAKIAANVVTAEHIHTGLPLGRRNFIINGNGYINQRFGTNYISKLYNGTFAIDLPMWGAIAINVKLWKKFF